jgi:hypothetical protein
MRRFAERANSIVRWSDVNEDGHFAAREPPDSLLSDLRAFVCDLRTDSGTRHTLEDR